MRESEFVDLHEIRPTEEGWEVTVFQTPRPLKLPRSKAELLSCLQEEAPVRLVWDSESLEIIDAQKVI